MGGEGTSASVQSGDPEHWMLARPELESCLLLGTSCALSTAAFISSEARESAGCGIVQCVFFFQHL